MVEAKAPKPVYGAVPVRAARDRRVTDNMLRTLIIVAAHDRLNRNGTGCYATQRRLAALIGGDHTRISKSLSALVDTGYLTCTVNAINARVNVYRVVYTDEDRQMMVGAPANTSVGGVANVMPQPDHDDVGADDADVGGEANRGSEDVGAQNGQPYETKGRSEINILGNTSSETIIHSAEAAPPQRIGVGLSRKCKVGNPGANLAIIERALRDGGTLDAISEKTVADILDQSEPDDPLYHQAERILAEYGSSP